MDVNTIILLIISVLFTILTIVFFWMGRSRQTYAPFIKTAIFFALIGNWAVFFVDSFTLFFIGVLFVNISFLFLFLHGKALISQRPTMGLFMLILGLDFIAFFIIILNACGYLEINPTFLLFRLISSIANFIAIFQTALIEFKVNHRNKINPTRFEFIAILCLLIYRSLFLFRDIFVNFSYSFSLVSNIGLLFSIIGITILILNYIIYPGYIYYLPFPIHSILLYNPGGLNIYSQNFSIVKEKGKSIEYLVSSAFSAISTLIEETLGMGAKLKFINADQYKIYFVEIPSSSGTLAVISEGSTYFFKRSLQNFVQTIPSSIITLTKKKGLDLISFGKKMDELIKNSFPYIRFL